MRRMHARLAPFPWNEQQAMALSAAVICAGATVLNLGEFVLPGGPELSVVPGLAALVLTVILVMVGPRLPARGLFAFGPSGVLLIGVAVATTTAPADGAILYVWPAVWTAYFFGARGTVGIVAWVGIVQAGALLALPPGLANVDRWVDVEVAVLIVAGVVRVLAWQNQDLVHRLAAEARRDPLTGLLNRRGFDERMEVESVRAARDGTWVGVATFDLDHFKRVNDQHGHEIGDRVLVWFGAVLQEQTRSIDVAARFGGEEFVVLLPGADPDDAERLAERIRLCVAEGTSGSSARCGVPDHLEVSVSAGIAARVAPVDPDALLAQADRALYEAKRNGRDRVEVADDAFDRGRPGDPETAEART